LITADCGVEYVLVLRLPTVGYRPAELNYFKIAPVMDESLSGYAHRLKVADRERLGQLPPETAQAEVEAILNATHWTVKDDSQLAWPGDLADDDPALWFGSHALGEDVDGGE
jgi:hypothetical protein